MGIADRDYARTPPPRGGTTLPAPRRWSANTWLIVICVAVFVVDGFLPQIFTDMGGIVPADGVTEFPPDAQTYSIRPASRFPERLPDGRPITGDYDLPIRGYADRASGALIGYQVVQLMPPLRAFLHFSTYELVFHLGFWRVIGFQFLHFHFIHLVMNMVGLFFFGPIVEARLGGKRYLAFYLLCGIFGALLYGMLNLGGAVASIAGFSMPGLLFNELWTPLIGASAGVFGVIMAGAYLVPNERAAIWFIIPVPIRWLAYGLVALALFTLLTQGENAGGQASHLGGAIAGFYFIRNQHHLHGFFDVLGRVDPTSHHYRTKTPAAALAQSRKQSRRKQVGPKPTKTVKTTKRKRSDAPTQAEIDRILDKISRSNISALTDEERQTLSRASELDP